jgi:hypothetical protein
MHFSLFDKLYWAAGPCFNAVLLFVLLWRSRWTQFPILTTWIAFQVARTLVLFFIYLHDSRSWYARIYVGGSWIDFILQLGVVLEIARIVLRPTGTWVRDARPRFIAFGLAGATVAALVAWWVSPPAWSVRFAWQIRADLFTSLVVCELFVVMSLTANRLGLGWRSHVMAVGQGLTAWTSLMVVTTALQSSLGTRHFYAGLDQIRGLAYVTAITWMIFQLWRDEPQRQPISSDLQEYILALHKRVEYDLQRLDARH